MVLKHQWPSESVSWGPCWKYWFGLYSSRFSFSWSEARLRGDAKSIPMVWLKVFVFYWDCPDKDEYCIVSLICRIWKIVLKG